MVFTIIGAIALLASIALVHGASRLHKRTLALMEKVEADIALLKQLEQDKAAADAAAAADAEQLIRLPDGSMGRAAEYETRGDGKLVRRDRWKTGFGNVATILIGSRSEFEIPDIVEKVRELAEAARADYESGGNGTFGSAPLWGPCPNSACRDGQVREKGEWADCPVCEGRAKVVVEEPLAAARTEVVQ
jgi:hypothetical protein